MTLASETGAQKIPFGQEIRTSLLEHKTLHLGGRHTVVVNSGTAFTVNPLHHWLKTGYLLTLKTGELYVEVTMTGTRSPSDARCRSGHHRNEVRHSRPARPDRPDPGRRQRPVCRRRKNRGRQDRADVQRRRRFAAERAAAGGQSGRHSVGAGEDGQGTLRVRTSLSMTRC